MNNAELAEVKYSKTIFALSAKGTHTVKNQDSHYPTGNIPSQHAIMQLVCDGITGDEIAKEQHSGLVWAENTVKLLPDNFEAARSQSESPQFQLDDKVELYSGLLQEILDLIKPANSSARTVLRYVPIFISSLAGDYPYLTLKGLKLAMGTEGNCIVTSDFEADPDNYIADIEKHKQNLEGITTGGYVDFTKLAAATLQELRLEPQKYIQLFFPPEDLSLETIALLNALETTTEQVMNEKPKELNNVDSGTTISGALETNDDIIIFTLGDSRTAITIDGKLVALTGRYNSVTGLTSWVGTRNGQIYQNNGADISIIKIPKYGSILQGLCNLEKLADDDPFKLWLDETSGIDMIEAAKKAITGAKTSDDKTIVMTEFSVNNSNWRVISFTDGVFNPPPTQNY